MIALHMLLQASHPDDMIVCRDGETLLDFGTFRARVHSLVHSLREHPSVRFALCIDNTFEFACVLFALLASGKKVIVPANSASGYLADLAPAYDVLLTDASLARGAILENDGTEKEVPDFGMPIAVDARIDLYTSGSSSIPKSITKTVAQLNTEVQTLECQWGALIGNATIISGVPHHHIYGLLFRVLWPLAAGRPFERSLCLEPAQLCASDMKDGQVLISTPAQLMRWPALPGFQRPAHNLRAIFSSGGFLPADVAENYTNTLGTTPLEIYGSTETGGIAWRRQGESEAWLPLPGVAVHRGEDGALILRSPHLGHDEWHRTDDAVAFDTNGRFHLLGRLDRVTKVAGKRVSLPEIETRLAAHSYVLQAAAVPLNSDGRERIGVVVALTQSGGAALRNNGRAVLTKLLRRHLAAYFDLVVLPRHWRFHISLPFDARGKLPRANVAAAFDARPDDFEVLAEMRDGNEFYYELRVPPALVHFAGHFPQLPILPGVVQLDWVMRLAAAHNPAVTRIISIDRLKFLTPVSPGDLMRLTVIHDPTRCRVRFAYQIGRRDCASGVIAYKVPT